jgi:hypothetical protein
VLIDDQNIISPEMQQRFSFYEIGLTIVVFFAGLAADG